MQAEEATLIIISLMNNLERRNTMKKFETPVIEIAKFNVADVITTSTGTTGGNGPIMPDDEF